MLVLASSGMRAGGLDLIWDDLTPIYAMKDGSRMDSSPQALIFDWHLQPNMVNTYRLTVRKYNKHLPR